MEFRKHMIGGLVVGASVSAIALLFGETLEHPVTPMMAIGIGLTTTFFALFPDLDVSSVPQRWYFRAIFLSLLVLSYYDRYLEATLLSIVSITPLLDHHRSWTHQWWTPFLFPIGLAALYEYLLTRQNLFQGWSPEQIVAQIVAHLDHFIWFVVGGISGWLVHLLLDRSLPFFKRGPVEDVKKALHI